jgi:hypothetical protein
VQGGVVDSGLAFTQVVHQKVPDRPAFDAVAVDQLLAAELPLGPQRPPGRGSRAEDPRGPQQLVEVRAGGVAAAQQLSGDLQQLQAVADGDISDRAALGGQDRRDPAQRQLRSVAVDVSRLSGRGQGGESGWVADAGHLRGQAGRGGRCQQPAQAGADHVRADQQHDRPAGQQRDMLGVAGPAAGGCQPPGQQPPPRGVARGIGPAGDPPVLPGLTRLGLQPVQHPDQAAAALLVQVCSPGGERRRQHPSEHLRFRLAGQHPAGRHRPWREPAQQRHRRDRTGRQRPRPLIDRRRRRTGNRSRAGWPASAAHRGPGPNSTLSDSGRYPAAASAPPCPTGPPCLRAWCATTAAMTSSSGAVR